MMQPAEKVEGAKQGYRRYACPVCGGGENGKTGA